MKRASFLVVSLLGLGWYLYHVKDIRQAKEQLKTQDSGIQVNPKHTARPANARKAPASAPKSSSAVSDQELEQLLEVKTFADPYAYSDHIGTLKDWARGKSESQKALVVPYLFDLIDEQLETVRFSSNLRQQRGASGNLIIALETLGEIASPAATEPLGEFLERDIDYWIYQSTAVMSLGQIGDPRAVPYLDGYIAKVKQKDLELLENKEALQMAIETRNALVEFSAP